MKMVNNCVMNKEPSAYTKEQLNEAEEALMANEMKLCKSKNYKILSNRKIRCN